MKQILKHILILAFAAGFIGTACENNDLNIDAGTFTRTRYRSFYGYITKR